MEKVLKVFYLDNNKKVKAFPNESRQIVITDFTYNAQRMGGAPTITTSVMFPTCLDNVWKDSVWVEFNGEKYYLKQTPTSSKNNTDATYKHDLELVSERVVLDNVLFFDVITGDSHPSTNSSSFSFNGTIHEFASRLNASLAYAKVDYRVEVDNELTSDAKFLSFENKMMSEAIQEVYNVFEIPYYFVGKNIHFGFYETPIRDTFRYGADKELLSITKTNANQKVITRITGTGSEDNIPYYYPNAHPQGEIVPRYESIDGDNIGVQVSNEALFNKNILYTDEVEYTETVIDKISPTMTFYNVSSFNKWKNNEGRNVKTKGNMDELVAPNSKYDEQFAKDNVISAMGSYAIYNNSSQYITTNEANEKVGIRLVFDFDKYKGKHIKISSNYSFHLGLNIQKEVIDKDTPIWGELFYEEEKEFIIGKGEYFNKDLAEYLDLHCPEWDKALYLVFNQDRAKPYHPTIEVSLVEPLIEYKWRKGKEYVSLDNLGLSLTNSSNVSIGDKITFEQVKYIQPMQTLMPPVYWNSNGKERFYEAHNNTYTNPDTKDFYNFETPYSDSKRIEHIVEFPDIKPTIENVVNAEEDGALPINVFTAFAYDYDDSNDIDENGNYLHPYFYGKLRKFSGKDGFNLFTHANEKGEVTFSMKTGNCGACNFKLLVNKESLKNDLQVDENGDLIYEDGKVKRGEPQDRQNDTSKYEVWVALEKDTQTYGSIRPFIDAQGNKIRPAAGDEFVLLNISLPTAYIRAAEGKLEQEIIRYMYENNSEKFSFAIKFSRIYLEENPHILEKLNENAFIKVQYNGIDYGLYVNSFGYKSTSNEALPEITVELTQTLSVHQNAIKRAVSQVKDEILDRVQKMDIVAMVASQFISKENEDYAKSKISFNKGLSVGNQDTTTAAVDEGGNADFESVILKSFMSTPKFVDGLAGEGFKMWLDEFGKSHLTVDVLTAREKMVIYELLISKTRAVNGGLWVSAANGRIAKVEEVENNYEIYLEDINTFQEGDYIRCQVYRGIGMKSYWVQIDSIDGGVLIISKDKFIDRYGIPEVGDDIVLCGSAIKSRQNAILISASEDGSPRIDIYRNINSASTAGCLTTRLGNLDGISDPELKPEGEGLYSDNAYLKGSFVLKNSGESVDTMFAIQDGKINSVISQNKDEIMKGKTLLFNASFTQGLDGWQTSNTVSLYSLNGSFLQVGQEYLSSYVKRGDAPIANDVYGVTIKNGWLSQINYKFVNKPNFDIGKQYPLYFSTYIHCIEEGTLLVKIGEKEIIIKDLTPTDDYIVVEAESSWNGTGDFYLSFSGKAELYGITIYTDKVEVRHKTLFEQTERIIRATAGLYGDDDEFIKESGLVIQPDVAGLYARNNEGKQALIATYSSVEQADGSTKSKVLLEGDQIALEGDISANGNVSIDKQGHITAKGATIEGHIEAKGGTIGNFEISDGLEYQDINNDRFYAEIKEEQISIGGTAGYADLTSGRKSFTATGGVNKNGDTVLDCRRWTLSNASSPIARTPLVEFIDESSYPSVALKVVGGFSLNGGLLHNYSKKVLDNENSPNKLSITFNTHWVVKNKHASALNVYLPKLSDVLAMLNIQDASNKEFAIPMSVTLLKGSANIVIKFIDGESKNSFVDWDGGLSASITIGTGDTWEFLLINDNEEGYYAQVIKHTH